MYSAQVSKLSSELDLARARIRSLEHRVLQQEHGLLRVDAIANSMNDYGDRINMCDHLEGDVESACARVTVEGADGCLRPSPSTRPAKEAMVSALQSRADENGLICARDVAAVLMMYARCHNEIRVIKAQEARQNALCSEDELRYARL